MRKKPLKLRMAPVVVAIAAALLAISAHASTIYTFQTLDNAGDPAFNQLLGINSSTSPTIVGYFGDGSVVPNKGYSLAPPTSYTNENFPGSAQTQVTGITPNSPTTSVGFYVDGSGNNFGFVDQGGTFTSVANPGTPVTTPSTNQLLGVNDSGQAVGFYVDESGHAHGYLYDISHATYTPIAFPGATSTTATGINDAGLITGFYTDAMGDTHGFIDSSGTFTSYDDPGGTSTMFLGINASDEAVGSYVDGSWVTEGLLFNLGSDSYQTLDDPSGSATSAFGVTGTTINGINNAGDLVGFYSDGTNVNGFLATPAPTPEPTMISLLLIGKALMIGRNLRSRRPIG